MKQPAVSGGANGPWLLAIASGFLGQSAVPYRATLFDKFLRAELASDWHQDVANEPLRVLPGTGALGVLSEADIERRVRETPPVYCLVSSGRIVAVRPLILDRVVHSGNQSPAPGACT